MPTQSSCYLCSDANIRCPSLLLFQAVNDLVTELEQANITCTATITFGENDYKEQLRTLKASAVHVDHDYVVVVYLSSAKNVIEFATKGYCHYKEIPSYKLSEIYRIQINSGAKRTSRTFFGGLERKWNISVSKTVMTLF